MIDRDWLCDLDLLNEADGALEEALIRYEYSEEEAERRIAERRDAMRCEARDRDAMRCEARDHAALLGRRAPAHEAEVDFDPDEVPY